MRLLILAFALLVAGCESDPVQTATPLEGTYQLVLSFGNDGTFTAGNMEIGDGSFSMTVRRHQPTGAVIEATTTEGTYEVTNDGVRFVPLDVTAMRDGVFIRYSIGSRTYSWWRERGN